MTDEQIEALITRIIRRLQPPVLVLVAAAVGYRRIIRHRLAGCGQNLHLAIDEGVSDAEKWREIGEALPAAAWRQALPSLPYRALLVPFLDYSLAAELAQGTLRSPVAMRIHDALLAGMPVLALRYHCDPASELNQLRGAAVHASYAGQIQARLARLTECGVTLCTMNELLERLTADSEVAAPVGGARRYLTVTDVVDNPALASAPGRQLTDAASDFLKNRKRTLS